MRVKKSGEDKIGRGSSGRLPGRGVFSGSVEEVSPQSFLLSLEDAEAKELAERLNSLGEKLSRFPAEGLLLQYRSLVKEMLRRAVGGMKLRRDMKWRRTDRNLYVTVEKVESALVELEDIFLREGERTKMLQLMEEIKGCLLSILL